jgi:polyvinyl alcohol dehydrogenase (cytochrome)
MTKAIAVGAGSLIATATLLGAQLASAALSPPAAGSRGAELYAAKCAQCHEGGTAGAPHAIHFLLSGPETVLAALTSGVMQQQAAQLTSAERVQLAEFLGGRSLNDKNAVAHEACASEVGGFDVERPPVLDGWAFTLQSTRFISDAVARLPVDDIPRLELEWAFAFPGATRARSQPSIAGGAIFVGSQDGTVYSLDFKTGCVNWAFAADAEVRVAVSIERWRAGDASAMPRAFFADLKGNAYAVDARTGRPIWKRRVNPHPHVTITGSPRLHAGRLYVPISSTEFAAAADPEYPCCTFRGGVVALEAETGREVWTAYSVDQEPRATAQTTPGGRPRFAPAGVPIWNSPTIDAERNRLYVGTGESYTGPAAETSDAVLAIDLDTGRRIWHFQSLAQDAWNLACFLPDGPSCPLERGSVLGLDVDIGAPPVLVELEGRRLLIAAQKTARVFALDPDTGRLVWDTKTGRGGYAGGVHWGMAVEGHTLYAPSSDTAFFAHDADRGEAMPGMFALDARTGARKWFTPARDLCTPQTQPACDPGISAAATATPGAVFAGGSDGWLRAYDAVSGRVLWAFDTAREFSSLSGEKARGGSIGSAGPVVFDGAVLVNSGYLMGGRMPGNVLLKFSVPKSSRVTETGESDP